MLSVFPDAHISSYMHSLFPVQFILCSRCSDNKARRSDGGERVKSYAGKTTGKKGGETCLPSFFVFSSLIFRPRSTI